MAARHLGRRAFAVSGLADMNIEKILMGLGDCLATLKPGGSLMVLTALALVVPVPGASVIGPAEAFQGVYPAASSRALDGDELLRIGDIHEVQNHLQEALPYYQRALAAYREKRNRRGEAVSLQKIGRIFERQGKLEDSFGAFKESLKVLPAARDRGLTGKTLLRLGQVAEGLGRADDAESAYTQAREFFRQTKDHQGRTEAVLKLGLLAAEHRPEQASTLLREAAEEARRESQWEQAFAALIGLGDVWSSLDKRDDAQDAYEQALHLAEARRLLVQQAQARRLLAGLHHAAGRYAEARAMAEGALPLYQSVRERLGEADILSLLGALDLSQGNPEAAMARHQRALDLYRALRNRPREAGSLANLAQVYETQGETEHLRETRDKVVFLLLSLS
ncbi:MAG TPA: tetratricopeptide repeat protein [Nitrospiraceae bacterium]|nr:tetratricopeptide repeat protein [Nitrospiraceae bacterium]